MRLAIQLHVDGRDDIAVLVGAGDQAAVDAADVGLVRVPADDQIHRWVELLDDVDDGAGDARAFVVVPGREAAFMDQHDDGFHALGTQLRHQLVDRFGLIVEAQALDAAGRDDARRAAQREPDEGHGDAFEGLDLIGGEQGLAGLEVPGAGREVVVARAGEGVRALAAGRRVAAALLLAQQLGRAVVELVVADGAHRQAHLAECLDRRLVVEQRREQRAGAYQVTGRDEDVVRALRTEVAHDTRDIGRAAGMHGDGLAGVLRIEDPDALRRGQQIAVEIVQRQDADVDRRR